MLNPLGFWTLSGSRPYDSNRNVLTSKPRRILIKVKLLCWQSRRSDGSLHWRCSYRGVLYVNRRIQRAARHPHRFHLKMLSFDECLTYQVLKVPYLQVWNRRKNVGLGNIRLYLYLIVPFWYASAAYQASLVEPWFVFWRDAVEPKYPWRDQTSLICRRSVPKRYD